MFLYLTIQCIHDTCVVGIFYAPFMGVLTCGKRVFIVIMGARRKAHATGNRRNPYYRRSENWSSTYPSDLPKKG